MRIVLLVFFLFSLLPLWAQEGQNFSFEIPEPSDVNKPVGWKFGRLIQTKIRVANPAGAGNSLLLQAPFTEHGSGMAYQMLPANKQAFTRYRVTGKIRTEGVEGAGAQLYAYGRAGEEYFDYQTTESLSGDQPWREVSLTFFTDERVDSIRIGCFLDGSGKAWFDELTFTALPRVKGGMSSYAKAYFKEFFSAISPIALDREQVDWKALQKQARRIAAGAQQPADLYSMMMYTLRRINKHSFMYAPATAAGFNGEALADDAINPDLVYTSGHRIDDQISYLSMPGMGSGHQPTLVAFADSMQALIANLDSEATNGWVLDLRNNGGGNCWPMLAGIGPLLGEGICGYFMDRDGGNAESWSYRAGSSFEGENARTTVSRPAYELKGKDVRVAVLTGPQTASSGEVTAIAFRGKANTRSFGAPTAGYSTTNTNINMSDGAMLLLTISIYGDRHKTAYGETVQPDVVVENVEGKDAALEAAISWLRE